MDLKDKNVIIIGGFGGIGFETCKEILKKNPKWLVIFDLLKNEKLLVQLQNLNTTKVIFSNFDITDLKSIQQAFQNAIAQIENIDILINAAGVLNDRNVELTINVNLVGNINTILTVLPLMDKRQQGRGGLILNIASVLGLEPCGGLAVYSASKWGVCGFSRSMANPFYYNLTGVSIITMCPGITTTPLLSEVAVKGTFEYSQPLLDQFFNKKSQEASVCAAHIVNVIESNKNGSIWISDVGVLKEVKPTIYWN